MTAEEQFKAWWFKVTHPWTEFPKDPMELSKIVWDSAWTTATLGQFERAKAEAEAEIRAKLLALAVEVFKEGDTQRAQIIRDLADIRHNIWPEPL